MLWKGFKLTSKFNSPQEEFWAKEFGDSYISRNQSAKLLASNTFLFAEIFSSIDSIPQTFLEIGANIGMNVRAIKTLSPEAQFTGIEINKQACQILAETGCKVVESSIADAEIASKFDFVFSKGVLIHLSPDQLQSTYKKMYEWSNRFILIAEYYNPVPVAISYRGNSDRLFKRDFAGEFMDLFQNVKLRDFGFAYHRGNYPQDDINWFLLEKTSTS
jgi:pseudaminic acid biosynthesis-associated methylase